MRSYLLLLLLLLPGTSGFAQLPVEHLALALPTADFSAVYQVKDSLLNYQQEAVPSLIKLLRDTSFVKLQNTADLIYPGAATFYGHGWIIAYDIDWVAVRSAWLLEELTFQDFGYRDRSITEAKLLDLRRQVYQPPLQEGFQPLDFNPQTPRERLKLYRAGLADKVASWWREQQPTWTRYKALREALASGNEQRQALAIHYLRFGKTRCTGLTLAAYESELKPLLIQIKHGTSREAKQATYILEDEAHYWLTSKNVTNRE
jgi:hypothetical protein